MLGAMLFLPAGTFHYWQAWVYLAILTIPMVLVMTYLIRKDPELLERRMRMREKEAKQRTIIKLSYLFFLVAFLIPGFDKRFGWSSAPLELVIIADAMVLTGYMVFVLVLRENRYASRIIEVEQKQKVITTGPYAVVRHPMYSGALLMYGFSPLALGSYWGMIPNALLILLIVARMRNEENVLKQELEGYVEYTQKVKYRLVPGIW
jgi:protein-S-isoprenylcysteine O-methyltransferase Ste14